MSFFSLAFPMQFFVAVNYLENNISFIFVKKEGAIEQCQAIDRNAIYPCHNDLSAATYGKQSRLPSFILFGITRQA
jgi:hypothetical protein